MYRIETMWHILTAILSIATALVCHIPFKRLVNYPTIKEREDLIKRLVSHEMNLNELSDLKIKMEIHSIIDSIQDIREMVRRLQ